MQTGPNQSLRQTAAALQVPRGSPSLSAAAAAERWRSAIREAQMSGAGLNARVERIARKLRTAVRGKLKPFGAELHPFRRKRRHTEQQVTAFERRYAVKLPPEYRASLTGVANGGAGPAYGMYSLAEAVISMRGRVPDDFLRTPSRTQTPTIRLRMRRTKRTK